mgnify:CR=1 FL=1
MNHGVRKLIIYIIIFILSFSLKAQPIKGISAQIQILDKITSRVNTLDINIDESKNYESLIIEVYACYKNPPEDIPEDYVLLKIYDNINLNNINKNNAIYKGWMISSSPASTPLEHPIYDLWLKSCNMEKDF